MVSLVCSVFLTGTYILPNDSRYGGAIPFAGIVIMLFILFPIPYALVAINP